MHVKLPRILYDFKEDISLQTTNTILKYHFILWLNIYLKRMLLWLY